MRFIEFRNALKSFTVFSYPDILKVDPLFDRRRLVEWQQQNHIRKVRNGYYTFADTEINEATLFHLSNNIYKPSYISLETALSYYNLIPEAVYLVTGISTRKTMTFATQAGNFAYRTIKESLYFGYNLAQMGGHTVRIANPEKSLLDMLYLNKIDEISEIEGMRINHQAAIDLIDLPRIEDYLMLFQSGIMEKRVHKLINHIYAGA